MSDKIGFSGEVVSGLGYMYKAVTMRTLSALAIIFCLVGLGGCGGCNMLTSLPVELSIPIKDPVFAQLAAVVDNIELAASGDLKSGHYVIENVPLDVPEGTAFKLRFKLPLHGASVINVKDAAGDFSTSKELKAYGAPVPKGLKFSQGRVTGHFQFVRALCAFLMEIVNRQPLSTQGGAHDVANMMNEIRIEMLRLDLKPDSNWEMPGVRLAIGQDSAVIISDVKVDRNLDYTASCQSNINLRPGSQMSDEKNGLAVSLGEGVIAVHLVVASKGGLLEVRTQEPDQSGEAISVRAITLSAKQRKSECVVKCASAAFKSLSWSTSRKLGSENTDIKAAGRIMLTGAGVSLSKPEALMQFKVPSQVTLSVAYQQNEQGRSFRINSPAAINASDIALVFARSDGKISIALDRASVDCSIASTPELTDVTLPRGKVVPRRLVWERAGRVTTISMPSSSVLSLTRDVKLALDPARRSLEGSFPILFRGGTTTITGPANSLTLDGINGNMTLDLSDRETSLSGKLSTTIEHQAKALGGTTKYGVSINSVRLSSGAKHLVLELGGCRLAIPRATIEQVICAKLPQARSFAVNKKLLENSRWRYRNLIVREGQIGELKLQQFRFSGANSLEFAGDANLVVRGTVERGSSDIMNLLQGTTSKDGWNQRPWTAVTHVTGSGNAQFTFNPGDSLANSSVTYNVALKTAVPDDLELDWSHVCDAGDMLGRAEPAIVRGALKVAQFCIPPDQLSVKRQGDFKLFPQPSQQLRAIKIEHPVARIAGDDLTVDFGSHVEL